MASGSGYASKPRPAVIVQDDSFSGLESVTICGFTSDPTRAPLFRITVEPLPSNGLRTASRIMVDKLTTVRKSSLGQRLGRLSDEDLLRLNRAMLVFLGMAVSPRSSKRPT